MLLPGIELCLCEPTAEKSNVAVEFDGAGTARAPSRAQGVLTGYSPEYLRWAHGVLYRYSLRCSRGAHGVLTGVLTGYPRGAHGVLNG